MVQLARKCARVYDSSTQAESLLLRSVSHSPMRERPQAALGIATSVCAWRLLPGPLEEEQFHALYHLHRNQAAVQRKKHIDKKTTANKGLCGMV